MLKCTLALLVACSVEAQTTPRATNIDEAKVGAYSLPPLGAKSSEQWQQRRAELRDLFAEHVYGRTPLDLGKLRVRIDSTLPGALQGMATRTLVHLSLADLPQWTGLDLLLYVPSKSKAPTPCFVALNLHGNHAVTVEGDVPLTTHWIEDGTLLLDHHATKWSRGSDISSWPLADLMQQGFAVATAFYGDLEPDHDTGFLGGIRGAVAARRADTLNGPHAWGAIGAWAWGMSCIVDYLVTEPTIDHAHLMALGHSRLGKAALWAAAQDERFAMVFANESGEGGAALMRRNFGETTADITSTFPHWFCRQYERYAGDATACPVDAHLLLAQIAPRPLYVSSADHDYWSDPTGEFLATHHASAAWQLLGKTGLGASAPPAVGRSIGNEVGYHVRAGEHGLTTEDWQHFIAFAKRHATKGE